LNDLFISKAISEVLASILHPRSKWKIKPSLNGLLPMAIDKAGRVVRTAAIALLIAQSITFL
jgi:hypothetical protein